MLKHSITKVKVPAVSYTSHHGGYVPSAKYTQQQYDDLLKEKDFKVGDWICSHVQYKVIDTWSLHRIAHIETDVSKIHSYIHSGVPEGILGIKAWITGEGISKWECLTPIYRRKLTEEEIKRVVNDQVLDRVNQAQQLWETIGLRRPENGGGSIIDPETPTGEAC